MCEWVCVCVCECVFVCGGDGVSTKVLNWMAWVNIHTIIVIQVTSCSICNLHLQHPGLVWDPSPEMTDHLPCNASRPIPGKVISIQMDACPAFSFAKRICCWNWCVDCGRFNQMAEGEKQHSNSQNPYTGPTKGTRGLYVVTRVTNAIWQTGVQAGWRAEAYSTNSLDSWHPISWRL